MGPVDLILGALQPILDEFGITREWLLLMAANIVGIVAFVKRAMKRHGWAVWVMTGVLGAAYAAIQFRTNIGALVVGAIVLVILTAGQLAAAGRLGNFIGNRKPLGAGDRRVDQ